MSWSQFVTWFETQFAAKPVVTEDQPLWTEVPAPANPVSYLRENPEPVAYATTPVERRVKTLAEHRKDVMGYYERHHASLGRESFALFWSLQNPRLGIYELASLRNPRRTRVVSAVPYKRHEEDRLERLDRSHENIAALVHRLKWFEPSPVPARRDAPVPDRHCTAPQPTLDEPPAQGNLFTYQPPEPIQWPLAAE